MANHPTDGPDSDYLAQILGIQALAAADPNLGAGAAGAPVMLQLNSGDPSAYLAGGVFQRPAFSSGLSLDQRSGGFLNDAFPGQTVPYTVPEAPKPPAVRPRVRARRGQATDPHSIAERMRRERIAERIRALQGLVPSVNKIDKVAMLDEVVDYVNFLRLQVKVLSMSRLVGSDAVAPLVTDIPTSSMKDEGDEGGRSRPAWEGCSNDGTERQVAELMEENVGAAMQFLQSKQLCIMPVSLASAMYHTPPSNPSL